MSEKIDNLILEHLKAIQSKLSGLREQNHDILKRLTQLERMVARQGRDLAELVSKRAEFRHSSRLELVD